MVKEIKKHSLSEYRLCPICGESKSTHMCDIEGQSIGIQYIHNMTVKLAICSSCGFTYANPTMKQEDWNEYYSDMFPMYNAHEDYSVDNRIELVKKHVQHAQRILEIGGNEQGEFADNLMGGGVCDEYLSYDVNGYCQNTLDSLDNISNVDVMVCYYVFEHLADINQMVSKYTDMIVENGLFIIEVPDANIYYRNPIALYSPEHVNHFTPESLSILMKKHGFICVEISRHFASRIYGFVGVYRKSQNIDNVSDDYIINKSLITDGLFELKAREENLEKTVRYLYELDGANNLKNLIFWCANSALSPIIAKYEDVCGRFEGTIIDENIKKKDYFGGMYPVHTSSEIFGNNEAVCFKKVIVCAYPRVSSVRDTLRRYGQYEVELSAIGYSMELVEL